MGGKGTRRSQKSVAKAPTVRANTVSEPIKCGRATPVSQLRQQGGNLVPDGGSLESKDRSSKISFPVIPSEISVADLVVDFHHKNRVLSGTLCVEPFVVNCVQTVLEDKFGNTVRLRIYDESVKTSRQNPPSLARYAKGKYVHIREPFYEVCEDEGTVVRVDNCENLYCEPCEEKRTPASSNPDHITLEHPPKSSVSEELDQIRREGNRLFAKQDWKGTINLYSVCITECLRVIGSLSSDDSSADGVVVCGEEGKLKETLVLAYSNRSETWLRLPNYDEALDDANKALELDANHVKSLVRKGKALYELQQNEESIACFTAALQESPDDLSIHGALARSRTSCQQSREGVYDLSDYYCSYCSGQPPHCSDFVGPVDIQRPAGGRRGLFVTKDVAAGDLLLVCKPIAVSRKDATSDFDSDDECGACVACEHHRSWALKEFRRRNFGSMDDLVSQLRKFSSSSRRRLHQVSMLAGANTSTKLDVPSIDLFRPDSDWKPSSEKQKLDSERLREIVLQNCVDELTTDSKDSELMLSGLWLLPSVMNHSCCANAETSLVGETMFVRALRPVSSGEELTRAYFDTLKGLERRQEVAMRWCFKCSCQRCEWERNIPEPQNKMRKKLCNRVQKFCFEAYASSHAPNLEKLAGVVSSVEETIESVKLEGKFQQWIRASLMDAFIANVHVLVGIPTRRIEAMKTVLEAMTAVGGGLSVRLQIASTLLREVKRKHGRSSPVFQETKAYVAEIYKPFYGNLNKKVFWALASMHGGGDGLD